MADRFSIILTWNFWFERNMFLSDFHFTLRVFLDIIGRNFLFDDFDIDRLWRSKLIFNTFYVQGICYYYDCQYGGSFFDSFHLEFLVWVNFQFSFDIESFLNISRRNFFLNLIVFNELYWNTFILYLYCFIFYFALLCKNS